jgi:hypothetical protein
MRLPTEAAGHHASAAAPHNNSKIVSRKNRRMEPPRINEPEQFIDTLSYLNDARNVMRFVL